MTTRLFDQVRLGDYLTQLGELVDSRMEDLNCRES